MGKIVGEKLVDSPTGLVHDTGKYWHGVYVEGKKQSASMTAEQIAFSTGNIAGNIAVGAVTGYALK